MTGKGGGYGEGGVGVTEVGVRLRLWGARRIWGRLLVSGSAAPTVNDV